MSQAAPFKNIYRLRKVSENDGKACSICYKSTNSVLITLNSKDWFYVCEAHLHDRNFCTIVYMDNESNDKKHELEVLINKENIVLKKIKHLESLKETKDSQFTKIKGYLWSSKKKDDDSTKPDEDKDKDKKEELKDTEMSILQLSKKIKELNSKDLLEIKEEIVSFNKNYKKFKLDAVFYKNRLLVDFKKQRRIEQQKKMAEGTLFPSLGELSSIEGDPQ